MNVLRIPTHVTKMQIVLTLLALTHVNVKMALLAMVTSAQVRILLSYAEPYRYSSVAGVVNWGGGEDNILIFVFTDHENSRFQKELLLRNTNI